jgi:endonuclease YncB( thermonuclease family)
MKTAPPFDAEGRFHSLAGGMSGTGSGQQIACGTMSLAALEPLMPEVNVRCVVIERDRHGRLVAKVFSPNWGRHRPQVGLGGVGAGVPAVFEELRRRRERGSEGQARDVAGHLREPWEWRASSPPQRT